MTVTVVSALHRGLLPLEQMGRVLHPGCRCVRRLCGSLCSQVRLGPELIRQRGSVCQGTDIKDVALGKLLSNSVWPEGRNLVRNEAKDRQEPRS